MKLLDLGYDYFQPIFLIFASGIILRELSSFNGVSWSRLSLWNAAALRPGAYLKFEKMSWAVDKEA